MSTQNIVSVEPVMLGPVPAAVIVVFKTHGKEQQRAYLYSSLEAIRGILAGEDPSQWTGERIDPDSGGGSIGGGIGGEAIDIAELGSEIL